MTKPNKLIQNKTIDQIKKDIDIRSEIARAKSELNRIENKLKIDEFFEKVRLGQI
jgi:hypothetical protein